MEEPAAHHVGATKVALEHNDPDVLQRMKKPEVADYDGFADAFKEATAAPASSSTSSYEDIASHSRQRPERDDRPGPVPEQRLPSRPGPDHLAFGHRHPQAYTGSNCSPARKPCYRAKHLRDRKPGSGPCSSSSSPRTTSRFAKHSRRPADTRSPGWVRLDPANPLQALPYRPDATANKFVTEGRHVHTIPNAGQSEWPVGRLSPCIVRRFDVVLVSM